ncbi:MAG: hypothetical protein U0183_10940 [Polyangiaceae bacterium]
MGARIQVLGGAKARSGKLSGFRPLEAAPSVPEWLSSKLEPKERADLDPTATAFRWPIEVLVRADAGTTARQLRDGRSVTGRYVDPHGEDGLEVDLSIALAVLGTQLKALEDELDGTDIFVDGG